MTGFAIVFIPSAVASIGGVLLSGGHAAKGGLAVGITVVLVASLVTGVGVMVVGFKRFLAAQADARRRAKDKDKAQQQQP